MSLAELLQIAISFQAALVAGLLVSLLAVLIVTPRAIRKLLGARITGKDRHKEGRPVVAEMGGLAVFLALNAGAFTVLALGDLAESVRALILAALVVAAGACITGVLDDLVELRQRFKAFIPFAFAVPLALFVPDTVIMFPRVGAVDFGLLYPLLIVPLAIACASNGFNMLEGFNGMGAGIGIILASAISVLAILEGNLTGLALLFPLVGALGGFLWYNAYPARIFPGDSMTLLVGAVLAAAAILSGIEFWGGLLFLPHILEFFLKAKGGFRAQTFATEVRDGVLHYEGPTESITHILMRLSPLTEPRLVARTWILMGAYSLGVVGLFLASRRLGWT